MEEYTKRIDDFLHVFSQVSDVVEKPPINNNHGTKKYTILTKNPHPILQRIGSAGWLAAVSELSVMVIVVRKVYW